MPLAADTAREHRRIGEAVTYAAFGIGSYLLFRFSGLDAHITWAHCAVIGYLVAALLSVGPASDPRMARIAAITGAVVVPFVMLLDGHHQMQDEVGVISRSGELLLSSGIPYVHDATTLGDINPYLPFMAVFGIPAALVARSHGAGSAIWSAVGDPRIWCALIAIAGVIGSMHLLRARSQTSRTVAVLLIASPTIALEMCSSGVDLPLAGLLLLGLALAATRRPALGALCIGAAFAIKWVAIICVPVIVAMLVVKYGRRDAVRFATVFSATAVLLILPAMFSLTDAVHQVLEFPTGNGDVSTPAHSELPGVLIASLGPAGRVVDIALLGVCASAIVVWLIRRPPATFAAAATIAGCGFTCFFLLAPVGRFGYMLLPILLFGLAYIARINDRRPVAYPADSGRVTRGTVT